MSPRNLVLDRAAEALARGGALVWGHRGARAYAPMNTLPSFELAARQGADGIELDVQLSADGVPVVIHDFTVDGTTDGTGAVKGLAFSRLRELDASARFTAAAEPLDGSGIAAYRNVRIPTLEEALDFARTAADGSFLVNVEIKAPFCDASGSDVGDGVEEATAAALRRTGMAERVIVSSFNPPSLRRFAALMPEVPLGFLYAADVPVDTAALVADLDRAAWHPNWKLADAASVAAERAAGRIVNCWTVNDASEAAALAARGVAGIITDEPDRILASLLRR